jgi:hypothetical protein
MSTPFRKKIKKIILRKTLDKNLKVWYNGEFGSLRASASRQSKKCWLFTSTRGAIAMPFLVDQSRGQNHRGAAASAADHHRQVIFGKPLAINLPFWHLDTQFLKDVFLRSS